MPAELSVLLSNEDESNQLGAELVATLPADCTVFMRGQLGAGKTTIVRAALRAMGVVGAIPSPTYTLAEIYSVAGREAQHFDLYRLADPEEFELIGARDFFARAALRFIEWPENGEGFLGAADVEVVLQVQEPGRLARIRMNNALMSIAEKVFNSLYSKGITVSLNK